MAPSLFKTVGAAAVALAAHAGATKSYSYKVTEVYNSTNFFDKFDFFSGTDPNGGYVQYQNKENAKSLGLVKYQDDEVYVGVDHTKSDYSPSGAGRKSVRLESKNVYNKGLVVADFTYLPKPVCGSWPAFWFFGEPWPTKGEIDIYENWNDLTFNRHTAHVDAPKVVGDCSLVKDDMTATIDSPNCYDFADGQANYQGCSASEYSSTFGSPLGGIFAMEWTDDFLKIWDWPRLLAPADVLKGKPEPSTLWGKPSYVIQKCNINKAFKDMKMVLNVNFCSVAGQDDKWGASCKAKTGYATCTEYVAKKAGDFELAKYKIKDIKIYQKSEDAQTSTSTSSTSTTSASTSTTSQSTTTTTSSTSTTSTTSTASTASSTSTTSSTSSTSSARSTGTITSSSTHNTAVPTGSGDDEDDDSCTDENEATSSSTVSGTVTNSYNSSSTYHAPTSTKGQEMTTSTIYETSVRTITSCAPTVTNCPIGSVTSEVTVSTTVCPITKTTPTSSKPVVSKPIESTSVVSTPVVSKPVESKPVESKPAESTPYVATTPIVSKPSETDVVVTATVVPITSTFGGYNATLSTAVTVPAASGTGVGGCKGSDCVVVVSGGVKTGASYALLGVAALFFAL
ncbi:glycoside hydrolase family 16 protein [Hypomontagnella monticulosa]|nr:glycoside hydrolase family 16 protein [Hypomontagnella monticulosa]